MIFNLPHVICFSSKGTYLKNPTTIEWLRLVVLTVAIFILIALAEVLRSTLKYRSEVTRKAVHLFTGLFIFFTPYLFQSAIPPVLIAVFFCSFNFICIRLGYFQSIHGSTQKSYGTVYYPLAFLILILLFWPTYSFIIQISFIILAISDPLAAIVGQKFDHPKVYTFTSEVKSLEGSIAFACSSFLLLVFSLYLLPAPLLQMISLTKIIIIALVGSFFTTFMEALSWRGSDNLTIPLGAAFILYFILTSSFGENIQLFIGFILAGFVALLSFRQHFLDLGGVAGTFVLGVIIFGVGGFEWAIPMILFFISSSLLSKLWQNRKKAFNLMYEKFSTRDIGQVLANGGVAFLTVFLFYGTGKDYWFLVFLGSVAAVTADTWATEIGSLSKSLPRLLTTLNPADTGTSGAVSFLGTIASVVGGIFIAVIGLGLTGSFYYDPFRLVGLISIAALLASLIDSLIGATLQAQYQCGLCSKMTERSTHCNGKEVKYSRGLKWLSNDIVNFICAFAGGIFVLIGLQFI